MSSLIFKGNLNLETAKVSDVSIDAEKFSFENDGLNYVADLITGNLDELNFNIPVSGQVASSTFTIENVVVSEPNITIPQAVLVMFVDEDFRKFKIDVSDVNLSQAGGSIKSLKVDGYLNKFNVLEELNIASVDSMPFEKSPKFLEVLARVNKSGDEQFQAKIEGSLDEFELFSSEKFIGLLPGGNFKIELEVNRAIPSVTSTSKINFNTETSADIFGSVEMGFSSELLTDLGCVFSGCELTNFDLLYKMNIDDEWIKGRAHCPNSSCNMSEMTHLVRTSNTINLFTILNETNILNPLSSLYLFGAISSGQKINEGHELKFQF